MFIPIQGQQQYLWRAVDQDGDNIDLLVQPRRNKQAAIRFFRRLLKGQGREPRWLITDKLRSYDAAHRTTMPTVKHINAPYANNRAEISHQPTRQQEYHLRGFSSSTQAQRFLALHGLTQNVFRLGRLPDAGGHLSALTDSGVPSLAGRRVCMKDGAALQRINPIFFAAC